MSGRRVKEMALLEDIMYLRRKTELCKQDNPKMDNTTKIQVKCWYIKNVRVCHNYKNSNNNVITLNRVT